MSYDPIVNFGLVSVSGSYAISDSGITLQTGEINKLPNPAISGAFNLTWWNVATYPDLISDPNKEIIRVNSIIGNILNVSRAQENTSASSKDLGSKMVLSLTKKTYDDIWTSLNTKLPIPDNSAIGDLLYYNNSWTRLPKGNSNQFLITTSSSISWVTPNISTKNLGVFAGGINAGSKSEVEYININALANALTFGSLAVAKGYLASCASSEKGIIAGGNSYLNTIEYANIYTTNNFSSFGTLTNVGRELLAGVSNSIKGLFGGGKTDASNYTADTDVVTIASSSTCADFANLNTSRYGLTALGDSIRAYFINGYTSGYVSSIDYYSYSTATNASAWGSSSTEARYGCHGCANSTRGLVAGGLKTPTDTKTNVIDYITIQSANTCTDFGDLSATTGGIAAVSGEIRSVFAGGSDGSGTAVTTISFVAIAITGNSVNVGDLSVGRSFLTGFSGM